MDNLKKYKHIIFDFDGVLAETNAIRNDGFKELFKEYPQEQQDKLKRFVEQNYGLSRYDKIKYFFEKVLGETLFDEELAAWADKYSDIVFQKVVEAPEVAGAKDFLKKNHKKYDFALVSSSDQEELRKVCHERGIDRFFIEILGSPMEKRGNIEGLLKRKAWLKKDCLLIGDSQHDFDAAASSGIDFMARNSQDIDWSQHPGVRHFNNFLELI